MMKNSPSRIAKRRRSALARRQKDIVTHRGSFVSDTMSEINKELLVKIKIAETDIANLERKGIRAS